LNVVPLRQETCKRIQERIGELSGNPTRTLRGLAVLVAPRAHYTRQAVAYYTVVGDHAPLILNEVATTLPRAEAAAIVFCHKQVMPLE